MLFNSYTYLLLFLPASLLVYFLLVRFARPGVVVYWLILASLFFYSFWNPVYLPLLLASMLFNYAAGSYLSGRAALFRRTVLVLGIGGNLSLLGYFKYADFFIENANTIFNLDIVSLGVVLPLAISFFTFQQIAFLVDSYKNLVGTYSLSEYMLFVTFFPQLIAGPIVHHSELIPQFRDAATRVVRYENISVGLFLLSLGLFKKVVIADTFAIWASGGFDSATALTFVEAWVTSLSYTLQLYFDFSGYADMAIGAGLLFNIRLPINFNSPYKATSVQDFWRRWHMTLSRFLRDYVYIPLGGSRGSGVRTNVNLAAVFLIGGLWHGAAWTFVMWGALHGIGMVFLNLWRFLGIAMPRYLAILATFLFVNVAWVFFRAETFNDAVRVLRGLVGLDGISLPTATYGFLAFLAPYVDFTGAFVNSGLQGNSHTYTVLLSIAAGLGIVFVSKNSTELAEKFKPNMATLLATVVLFMTALYNMGNISEFIYFNF